jgi:hypothetical protein
MIMKGAIKDLSVRTHQTRWNLDWIIGEEGKDQVSIV